MLQAKQQIPPRSLRSRVGMTKRQNAWVLRYGQDDKLDQDL